MRTFLCTGGVSYSYAYNISLLISFCTAGGGGGGYEVNTLSTALPLMGKNPLQGPLEGMGPENQDFLGLEWQ